MASSSSPSSGSFSCRGCHKAATFVCRDCRVPFCRDCFRRTHHNSKQEGMRTHKAVSISALAKKREKRRGTRGKADESRGGGGGGCGGGGGAATPSGQSPSSRKPAKSKVALACDNACGRSAKSLCVSCRQSFCALCDTELHDGFAALAHHKRVALERSKAAPRKGSTATTDVSSRRNRGKHANKTPATKPSDGVRKERRPPAARKPAAKQATTAASGAHRTGDRTPVTAHRRRGVSHSTATTSRSRGGGGGGGGGGGSGDSRQQRHKGGTGQVERRGTSPKAWTSASRSGDKHRSPSVGSGSKASALVAAMLASGDTSPASASSGSRSGGTARTGTKVRIDVHGSSPAARELGPGARPGIDYEPFEWDMNGAGDDSSDGYDTDDDDDDDDDEPLTAPVERVPWGKGHGDARGDIYKPMTDDSHMDRKKRKKKFTWAKMKESIASKFDKDVSTEHPGTFHTENADGTITEIERSYYTDERGNRRMKETKRILKQQTGL